MNCWLPGWIGKRPAGSEAEKPYIMALYHTHTPKIDLGAHWSKQSPTDQGCPNNSTYLLPSQGGELIRKPCNQSTSTGSKPLQQVADRFERIWFLVKLVYGEINT